jgi:hypothetical protein
MEPLFKAFFGGNFILNLYGGVINERCVHAYVQKVHRNIRFGSDSRRFMLNALCSTISRWKTVRRLSGRVRRTSQKRPTTTVSTRRHRVRPVNAAPCCYSIRACGMLPAATRQASREER